MRSPELPPTSTSEAASAQVEQIEAAPNVAEAAETARLAQERAQNEQQFKIGMGVTQDKLRGAFDALQMMERQNISSNHGLMGTMYKAIQDIPHYAQDPTSGHAAMVQNLNQMAGILQEQGIFEPGGFHGSPGNPDTGLILSDVNVRMKEFAEAFTPAMKIALEQQPDSSRRAELYDAHDRLRAALDRNISSLDNMSRIARY